MTTLNEWAIRWGIPYAAIEDLQRRMGCDTDPRTPLQTTTARTESPIQQAVRLEASQKGARLFRNNSGVAQRPDGTPIRFGLANDSAQMNRKLKSSDLIGIRPVLITPALVGHTLGQFLAREVKAPGWKYTGTDREKAQLAFGQLVISMGGDFKFATGVGTI